jgi:hypothetical protein
MRNLVLRTILIVPNLGPDFFVVRCTSMMFDAAGSIFDLAAARFSFNYMTLDVACFAFHQQVS